MSHRWLAGRLCAAPQKRRFKSASLGGFLKLCALRARSKARKFGQSESRIAASISSGVAPQKRRENPDILHCGYCEREGTLCDRRRCAQRDLKQEKALPSNAGRGRRPHARRKSGRCCPIDRSQAGPTKAAGRASNRGLHSWRRCAAAFGLDSDWMRKTGARPPCSQGGPKEKRTGRRRGGSRSSGRSRMASFDSVRR